MANGRFETIPPTTTLEDLEKHNRNWQRADRDLSSLQSQITNEQQARIAADNAHKNDTKAHPAENITYSGKVSGATNVKQAADRLSDRIDNIVAQGGSDNTEVVDARMGADGVARPTLGTLVREIHAQQIDSARQTVTLKHGQNIVTTDQASPAEIIVKGRTMVNLLGSVGGCESLEPFNLVGSSIELSQERYRSGQYAIKFTANGAARYVTYNSSVTLDKSKYYLLAAWVYTESLTGTGSAAISLRDYGTLTVRYVAQITPSDGGKWKLLYIKVPTNNILEGNGFTLLFGLTGTPTGVAYFDEVRLYEVTAEEYAAIGTTIVSDDDIDSKYPYVDGVQHVTNPVIIKPGKNLLPPFADPSWVRTAPGGTSIEIVGPYKAILNGINPIWTSLDIKIPALKNQTYTLALEFEGRIAVRVEELGANDQIIATPVPYTSGVNLFTFNTSSACEKLAIRFTTGQTTDTFTVSNPILVLGTYDGVWEPRNDDHIYAECTLAGYSGVYDTLSVETKTVLRRFRERKLDGSLAWKYNDSGPGRKVVKIDAFDYIANVGILVGSRYDGVLLSSEYPAGTINRTTISSGTLYIGISNDDSGWVDEVTPSTNAIKALFNGWKAVANNGTAYTSWVSLIDGSTPPTNTEAYVASNKAPGWTYWATIIYQVSPYSESVKVEGTISLHDGGNIIEIGEGVIVREKANPVLYNGIYRINDVNLQASRLQKKAQTILAVYKNNEVDPRWAIDTGNAYGRQKVIVDASKYDPDAEYYVTYIALDKYAMTANVAEASCAYNTNQKMVVDALTRDMADAKTEISIHDRILAELVSRLIALEEG